MKIDRKIAAISGSAFALLAGAGVAAGVAFASPGGSTAPAPQAPVVQPAADPATSASTSSAPHAVKASTVRAKVASAAPSSTSVEAPVTQPAEQQTTTEAAPPAPANTLPVEQGTVDAGGVLRPPVAQPTQPVISNPPPAPQPTVSP